jgi:hypothetical protein
MPDQRIEIDGWAVAEVLPYRRHDDYGTQLGGRLMLFRTAGAWTLLSIHTRTRTDDLERPFDGGGWARSVTYASLDELKAPMTRHDVEDWRALVMAGARNGDPDLIRLWVPVQIDSDLTDSSVHRDELRVGGAARREAGWREAALELAVDRLEQIGFVVLEADIDYRAVFPRGLGREWSNPMVGAVAAARIGHRVQLVVAVDDFGEVYTRTPDTNLTPGEARRSPPRPMSDAELDQVEEIRRRRHAEREARA